MMRENNLYVNNMNGSDLAKMTKNQLIDLAMKEFNFQDSDDEMDEINEINEKIQEMSQMIDEKYILLYTSFNKKFSYLIETYENESLEELMKMIEKLLELENIEYRGIMIPNDIPDDYTRIYRHIPLINEFSDLKRKRLIVEIDYKDFKINGSRLEFSVNMDHEYLRKLIYLHGIIEGYLNHGKTTLMNHDLFLNYYDDFSVDEIESYLCQ